MRGGSSVYSTAADEPVDSSLFPLFGSNISVDASEQGLVLSVEPGLVPFAAAFVVWMFVARPWRSFVNRNSAAEVGGV